MINTGPVTSHTVLLNLFPATQPHAEVEKKQRSTFSFKECNNDMSRIKKVYGGGGFNKLLSKHTPD